MAKIPFSIKYRPQIESGEYKVETRDGKPVRIICWDKKVFGGRTEIVALVPTSEGDTETVQLYCPDGKLIVASWNEKFKLFIVTPEPELTEWQRFISACLQKHGLLDCGAADRIAKESAAELLELARKETEIDGTWYLDAYKKGWDDAIDDYNEALRIKYEQGKAEVLKDLQENLANNDIYSVPEWLREVLLMAKENGKKEALKDLPRWKKFAPNVNNLLSEQQICAELENSVMRVDDGGYCWIISRKELNKLPKEDEK